MNPNWSRRLILGVLVDVLGHTLCSNEVKGHLRTFHIWDIYIIPNGAYQTFSLIHL